MNVSHNLTVNLGLSFGLALQKMVTVQLDSRLGQMICERYVTLIECSAKHERPSLKRTKAPPKIWLFRFMRGSLLEASVSDASET